MAMQTIEDTRLVIGPNVSLRPRDAVRWVAAVASLTFAIAGVLALRGLWPVLPFAGLEVAGLAAAMWVSFRHGRYREVIEFRGPVIRVEFGVLGRGPQSSVELRRALTRVWLEAGPYRNSPSRLTLACCGQRVELARCVTDEEREQLCERMRELIHPGWKRPRARTPEPAWVGH